MIDKIIKKYVNKLIRITAKLTTDKMTQGEESSNYFVKSMLIVWSYKLVSLFLLYILDSETFRKKMD